MRYVIALQYILRDEAFDCNIVAHTTDEAIRHLYKSLGQYVPIRNQTVLCSIDEYTEESALMLCMLNKDKYNLYQSRLDKEAKAVNAERQVIAGPLSVDDIDPYKQVKIEREQRQDRQTNGWGFGSLLHRKGI